MTSTQDRSGPIEVWLRQAPGIGIECTVVRADESTDPYDVNALSMRGAEREMTGYFISEGYAPMGRWETTYDEGSAEEVKRTFKPKRA